MHRLLRLAQSEGRRAGGTWFHIRVGKTLQQQKNKTTTKNKLQEWFVYLLNTANLVTQFTNGDNENACYCEMPASLITLTTLGCGRRPRCTRRTGQLLVERWKSNPQSSCCEAAAPTTLVPFRPNSIQASLVSGRFSTCVDFKLDRSGIRIRLQSCVSGGRTDRQNCLCAS